MNSKFLSIALFVAATAALSSCYYDNKEDLYQFVGDGCDTSVVTFQADVLPILQQNCAVAGCHSTTSLQSGLDLGSYADIQQIATDGRLMDRVARPAGDGLLMPPGNKLNGCDIDKINSWVARGALNN